MLHGIYRIIFSNIETYNKELTYHESWLWNKTQTNHLTYSQIAPEATLEIHMSRVVRKPAFCICENKDTDQLRSNCAADQRLCFRYIDSSTPLLAKSEISSL